MIIDISLPGEARERSVMFRNMYVLLPSEYAQIQAIYIYISALQIRTEIDLRNRIISSHYVFVFMLGGTEEELGL